MAESGIIREFLVALGFKSDEAALKKFEGGIDKTTKSVVKLATVVTATALAVSIGVTKIASNLEALYFASIKTNSSATNLKSFDRALQNLGTEAGEGLQSVQGLARFLRENPSGEGFLAGLGVQTRDANDELRDTTDLLLDLSKTFAGLPYPLAHQYAGMFGISEDTLRAMRSGGFEREVLRMRAQMKNTGFEQATKDAHRFMMEMRDLVTQLEYFGIQVYNAISRRLGGGLHSLTDWLRVNGPMLAERTADILVRILDLIERITPAITWLIDQFIAWDKATNGWSTRILALLAVLKMFGGFAIIGGVLSLAGAFMKLAAGIGAATAAGAGGAGVLGSLGLLGVAGGVGYGIGTLIHKILPDNANDKIGEGIASVLTLFRNKTASEALATNNPMAYLRMLGWTKEQAAGLVANLQAESGMNPRAVGDGGKAVGIAQWHPDRQAAFRQRMGKNVQDASVDEQLNFVDYELRFGLERQAGAMLRAATSARQAAEIVSRYYERPAAREAEAAKRGAAAVQLAQETHIHMHGGGDPAANGRAVAHEQDRVNARLTRNMQTAVQ